LSSDLWTARLLRDDPGKIVAVHRAYFAAGGPDGGSHEQGRLGARRLLVAGLPREPDTRGDQPLANHRGFRLQALPTRMLLIKLLPEGGMGDGRWPLLT
jgi:hypothetical protein